ncbi:CBS domain-containing protein [Embleya scabrispora]|uniref:CBS domain-containing protein n=1 Tax=Embleya scabrispora TaxID=159449 RepID=UPI000370E439|nr:CBS domain-containing protein [Embleya scabrispora]MYS83059.1 CBS domain-containing protein [Streptomyces sp. SID5474]
MTTIPHHRTAGQAGPPTVAQAMRPAELRIDTDTMVDKAIDIIHAADADHVILHAEDGRCLGVVRRAQLAPYRTRSWYTARTPIGNITHDRGPFARPEMPAAEALATMRARGMRVWAVTDEAGRAVGLLTPDSLRTVLSGTHDPLGAAAA